MDGLHRQVSGEGQPRLTALSHRHSAHGGREMPARYFFDIYDGLEVPDLVGSEWPNLGAARIEAVRAAADILHRYPERFWQSDEWTLTVSNSHRSALFSLKFRAEKNGSSTI